VSLVARAERKTARATRRRQSLSFRDVSHVQPTDANAEAGSSECRPHRTRERNVAGERCRGQEPHERRTAPPAAGRCQNRFRRRAKEPSRRCRGRLGSEISDLKISDLRCQTRSHAEAATVKPQGPRARGTPKGWRIIATTSSQAAADDEARSRNRKRARPSQYGRNVDRR
jgi:hypothetical protein